MYKISKVPKLKLNILLIFNQFLYKFLYLKEFVIIDLLLT